MHAPVTATPVQYAEALPRMIGYVPHESLLIASLPTRDARPAPGSMNALRLDLPTTAEDVAAVVAALSLTYLRQGHPGFTGWQDVMLLVWDEEGASTEHTTAALRAIMHATQRHTPYIVRTVLTITRTSVLGFLSTPDGDHVPVHEPRASTPSVLDTALILHGHQVLPDRQAVAATLAPDAHAAPLPTIDAEPTAVELTWQQAAAEPNNLTPDQSALLANGLNCMPIRDRAIASLSTFFAEDSLTPLGGALLTREQQLHLLDNLSRTARSYTDTPALADLLTVTAFTAWRLGQGTVAWIALDRAQRINPGHRFSSLLATALHRGADLSH